MNTENLLNGVENTLYIPLAARIYVSEKFPKFFYDEKALSLKQYIPTNSIANNTAEYFYMASVCRQQTIDKKIVKFLEENNQSNVVFLGAGLETAYNRINNIKSSFYQVDLPDVINIRKRVLGNADNERLISGNMFTFEWIRELDTSLSTMIVVSGVYQYFDKSKIIEMIKKMKLELDDLKVVFAQRLDSRYRRGGVSEPAKPHQRLKSIKKHGRDVGILLPGRDSQGFVGHAQGVVILLRLYQNGG